ncbi:heme oxygenase 1 [Desarmillaria tabescens]|uniref:Heme oxygenase 1 n=1 Tax=Armillaria tabescens TaxID=1929756 RepID=A0AA39NEP4_ARMTA|nr:heme oxygenase 1 [Desarmillaria tabescens]KAK0464244.1 heme oxygenase 1 [Desarmillaria tabescens]
MPSIIDYSQPLSAVLKEGTKEAHQNVQHSEGADALLRGELAKEEYARFLMMLWYIYDAFERALDLYSTHPVLEPTYNPALLQRAPSLAADISHLLQVPESSWKSHRIHSELMSNTPAALTEYVTRIQDLVNSADPAPLLAHSYVRYLGDLSGGQTIRHTLAKAYALEDNKGLSFYLFKELHSSKTASLGEMKRIKDWFRGGMDAGAGANQAVKETISEEAKTVFALNNGIFASIQPAAKKSSSKDLLAPVKQGSVGEQSFPLSTVMSVVAAVCIAHFILVVGGFMGEEGYAKLMAVEDWIASLWQAKSQ